MILFAEYFSLHTPVDYGNSGCICIIDAGI